MSVAFIERRGLTGVVENEPHCVTLAGTQTTNAVPHIHAIDAARSLNRPVVHSKCDRITLEQPHDFWPRLHPGTLLSQYKFTTGEIPPGL